jgi:hypothetical protein
MKAQTPLPLINDAFNSVKILPPIQQTAENEKLGSSQYTIVFEKAERLTNLESIGLELLPPEGTFLNPRELRYRWLSSSGKECFSLSPQQQDVHKFRPVWFKIDKACSPTELQNTTLQIESQRGVVFKTSQLLSKSQNNPLAHVLDATSTKHPIAGFLTLPSARATYQPRALGVLKMWGWDNVFSPIGGTLLLLLLGVLIATSLWRLAQAIEQGSETRLKPAYSLGLKTAVAAFLLSTFYATIVPPFQGPDEADHFRSFATATGRPELDSTGLALANRAHYDRLMCHMIERLDQRCFQEPMESAWPDHTANVDAATRSPWGVTIWRGISAMLPTALNANWAHWLIRVFNALYIGIAVGLAVLLLARTEQKNPNTFEKAPWRLALLSLFLIPTIWHFSNHNSNYAFIIAHYLVMMLFAWNIASGNTFSIPQYLFLAISTFLASISGKSALLSMVPLCGLFAVRQFVFGLSKTTSKTVLYELGGMSTVAAMPLLALYLFQSHPYATLELSTLKVSECQPLFAALFLLVPASLAIALALGHAFRKATARYPNLAAWTNGLLLLAAAGAFVLFLGLPLVLHSTPLANVETAQGRPDAFAYTLSILQKFLLNSSLLRDDFLLIRSYWAGFGCPEAVLPKLPVQLIQNVCFAGWFLGIFAFAKQRRIKETLAYLAFFLLTVLWLAGVAFNLGSSISSSIHGRYMIGFYLFFFSGALLGIWQALTLLKPMERLRPYAQPLTLALVYTLHAMTFSALFFRYFGL